MIEPVGFTEQMMYCTARIVGQINGSSDIKTGTGFFYNFPTEDGKQVPTLVTNKHVVENTSAMEFVVHASTAQNATKPDSNALIRTVQADWVLHPDPKVDLCAVPLGGVANTMRPHPFFRTLDPGLISSDAALAELNAVEDVLMVGYPNGLWDAKNNYPLIRKGITATHPAVDFDVGGVSATVVDIASFPGSSGSPVFIYNSGTIPDKKGNVSIGSRIIFLGVLFSGPTIQADGRIVIKNIPTSDVPVPQLSLMMNLGYIIKAKEIAALGEALFQRHGLR
jgi:Trypsin-like peptidase domain